MKVIAPEKVGVYAETISHGHCFLVNGIVYMRISGLTQSEDHIHVVCLSSGRYALMPRKHTVTPVNMTAVESKA